MSQLLGPVIEAARKGDREAMRALAGCVDRFLRLFSSSLSQNVRRAYGSTIDFVNEGLAEALFRIKEFEYRSDEEFYAWVARLIRNRIIDAMRSEGSKKRAGRRVDFPDTDLEPASPDPTPSDVVSAKEVRAAIKEIILELQLNHPQEMEVVLLKVFEGESWSSIQAWLGFSSQKRARTLFARGIDLLRPRVEEAMGCASFEEYLSREP